MLEKLNKQFIAARLGKEERKQEKDLLMTLKGIVDTNLKPLGKYSEVQSNDVVHAAAKSLIKGLNSLIVVGASQETLDKINFEIKILEEFLPKTLSREQVKEMLEHLNLSEVTDKGKRMGLAMACLKGQIINGKEVRAIVDEY